MFSKLAAAIKLIFGPAPAPIVEPTRKKSHFLSDDFYSPVTWGDLTKKISISDPYKLGHVVNSSGAVMDAKESAMDAYEGLKLGDGYGVMPEGIADWFSAQGFIGFYMCGQIAQYELVDKACTMPAEDAARNGWEISINDGTDADPELIDKIKGRDDELEVSERLIDFVRKARIFGIRVAIFNVESDDDEYYTKPFNPDGITPGSYKGFTSVDPMWITPELTAESTSNPSHPRFYKPTYWRIGSTRYHYSHLVVYIPYPVVDVFKPMYLYGGPSVPQRIYERVYAATRVANEAPRLAMSKRTIIYRTDLSEVVGKPAKLQARLNEFVKTHDNYGVLLAGTDDDVNQMDTALGEFEAVLMSQYQLVAAIAEVPATKLLGTTPKGFNSTGEFDSKSYHEKLESIQTTGMAPLLKRHYLLLSRSEFDGIPIKTSWVPLDSPTAKEVAETNYIKSQTALNEFNIGAIDGQDERQRLISDNDSGYSGMSDELPETEEGNDYGLAETTGPSGNNGGTEPGSLI